MIKIFRLSLIASVVLLAGCGGGDDEDISFSPTPSTPTPMLAMDGFATVTPNKESFIDLSSFVRGTEVNISSIKVDSDNEQCSTPTLSGTGVKVDITAGTFCQYTYTATQADAGQAQAALNVLATSAIEATLPPLSAALVVGTASTSFNVQTLLTNIGAWKSTYSLDTSSVTVHSTEGNLGSVDNITGNSFNFTPPELPGWNRIVFTLTDSEAPSAPVMGVLYVTISEEINQPPSISEPKYDYNANNPSATVVVGELVALDLASLPGLSITEPDNQEWQLVNALSWAATVDATDPNSVTNKSIDFTASSVGDHYVTYIVADHYGGYASGLIKITVGVKVDPATWDDIETNGITYSAPDTYVEATNKGWLTTPEWDNGVSNTVAGYTNATGQNYCNSVGTLPTTEEMGALYIGPASELALWPKEKPYMATAGTDYKSYDLSSGVISTYDSTMPHYVTCVMAPTMTLTMLSTTVVADGETHAVATVTMPNESDSFLITKAGGTLDPDDVNITLGTKTGSVTTLTTNSTSEGTYWFTVTNEGDIRERLTSSEVTYVAPRLNLTAAISADRGYPNSITSTPITVVLTDENHAEYTKGSVTITSNNASDVITPSTVEANEDGTFTVAAQYAGVAGTRTLTATASHATTLADSEGEATVTVRSGAATIATTGDYTMELHATSGMSEAEREEDLSETIRATITATQTKTSIASSVVTYSKFYVSELNPYTYIGNYSTQDECWEAASTALNDTEQAQQFNWAAYVPIGGGTLTPGTSEHVAVLPNLEGGCTLTGVVGNRPWDPTNIPETLLVRSLATTQPTSTNTLTLDDLEACSLAGSTTVTHADGNVIYNGVFDFSCDKLTFPSNWDGSKAVSSVSVSLTNNLGLALGALPAASQ